MLTKEDKKKILKWVKNNTIVGRFKFIASASRDNKSIDLIQYQTDLEEFISVPYLKKYLNFLIKSQKDEG